MSFGDTPLLLNRRRRVRARLAKPRHVGGIALPNLRPVRSAVFVPDARWRLSRTAASTLRETHASGSFAREGRPHHRPRTAGSPSARAEMAVGPHYILPGTSCSAEDRIKGACGGDRVSLRTLAFRAPLPTPRPNSLLTGLVPVEHVGKLRYCQQCRTGVCSRESPPGRVTKSGHTSKALIRSLRASRRRKASRVHPYVARVA